MRVNSDNALRVAEVRRIIGRRLHDLGIANPAVQKIESAGNQLLVSLPVGFDVARAKRLVAASGELEIKLVEGDSAPDRATLLANRRGLVPDNMEVVQGRGSSGGDPSVVEVRRRHVLTRDW